MSSVSSVTSAQSIKTDYLNLLITQMRNQNPLEPLNNNEMATQLAMFSQLEQLENQSGQMQVMNSSFDSVLSTVQRSQAASLIGKEVTFLVQDEEDPAPRMDTGRVEGVTMINGQPMLSIGDYYLGLDGVLGIKDTEGTLP